MPRTPPPTLGQPGYNAWLLRRRFLPRLDGTDVGNLVEIIREEGAARGMALYRYFNLTYIKPRIEYGLHPDDAEVEPVTAAECKGPVAWLTCFEGATPRSQAFKELSKMLARVRALSL